MKWFPAALMVVLVACPNPAQTNEALWRSKNLTDYEFTFREFCFCPPEVVKPVILEVRAGVLVSARYADGSPGAVPSNHQKVVPIDKLFRVIEGVQRGGGNVTSSFDATYGFPASIRADPIPGAVDDEFTYTITEFKPL